MESDLEEAESQDCSSTTTIFRTGDRYVFHNKHSDLVNVSQDKRTVSCQLPKSHQKPATVFSDQPLQDNEIFEVRIDDGNVVKMLSCPIKIGT